MATAKQIYDYIDSIAPFETAMSFDNVGILTGSEDSSSDIVMVALDATNAVIEEAAAKGAGIIVTHHPIIFHPLKRLSCDNPAYLAARYGITVISAHTNLDISRNGVNATLSHRVGVQEVQRFEEHCAILGNVNGFECAADYAQHIMSTMKLPGLRFTDKGTCRKVLVSCGAGGDNAELAVSVGADTLVTGEIKHSHIMYANDHNISVIDLGHFGSEGMIVPIIATLLAVKFSGTKFIRAESDNDGMQYLSTANPNE